MNDRAVALLEQYDIEVLRTRKGRGAILCDTSDGCLIFKEYTGNEDRLKMQDKLLHRIEEAGEVYAELLIPTKEGKLSVKDTDGSTYILKTYREGCECNIYDKAECISAVKLLAKLHGCAEYTPETAEMPELFSPAKEYEKRNRELKRVRKYLTQRGQKSWFEICLLNTYNLFLEQALSVTEEWNEYCRLYGNDNSSVKINIPAYTYCHGDYQYHNIIKSGGEWFLINFEKCQPDDGIRDLYLLMRKLLEKSNWSVSLGRELLKGYSDERPISAVGFIDLYYRLAYPEKFWKIVNFYYNSRKTWIPDRNGEKLDKLINQETQKQQFLNEVFRDVEVLRK
ncbi:MAG: CotS family spore coat protein [Lachnospiraceae bacterium]|nr:CotS family spore coat protein [Lachnospiraceae bacterium]